jgi:hypothetical protein
MVSVLGIEGTTTSKSGSGYRHSRREISPQLPLNCKAERPCMALRIGYVLHLTKATSGKAFQTASRTTLGRLD